MRRERLLHGVMAPWSTPLFAAFVLGGLWYAGIGPSSFWFWILVAPLVLVVALDVVMFAAARRGVDVKGMRRQAADLTVEAMRERRRSK